MNFQYPKFALWLSCVWALAAHAHEGLDVCGDEGSPAVAAPVQYHSPIQTYQHYRPTPVQPWSASNQTVQDVGGWRAYAKEAGGQP